MHAAEPGSDHQLAWVRALASVATNDAQLGLLAGLLDGSQSVPGLSVDAELRWTLLRRLVVTGRAGVEQIDSELERDPTAAGQRHAAGCRAARPTAEAKAEAWSSLVDSDELPNAVQAAVIGGFGQPEQPDLLEPYVERYFAALLELWSTRTSEMAQNLVVGLYPYVPMSARVVERTDAFLQSEDVPPAMQRLLLEGRDQVVRSLRAMARDAD